jgi:thiamine-phosphate pyrophosphorylase
VGAEDLPVAAARAVLGDEALLGGTAREPDEARAAVAAGVDYLGVGPCYPTTTKELPVPPGGAERIARVCAAVPVPVIAIGGVSVARVPELIAAGAYGVAVVGEVSAAADPAAAVTALLRALP